MVKMVPPDHVVDEEDEDEVVNVDVVEEGGLDVDEVEVVAMDEAAAITMVIIMATTTTITITVSIIPTDRTMDRMATQPLHRRMRSWPF